MIGMCHICRHLSWRKNLRTAWWNDQWGTMQVRYHELCLEAAGMNADRETVLRASAVLEYLGLHRAQQARWDQKAADTRAKLGGQNE